MFIDTHAHFDICIGEFGIPESDIFNRMKDNKVKLAVQVAVDVDNIDWTLSFCRSHDYLYFAMGVHPSSKFKAYDMDMLKEKAFESKKADVKDRFFAIGETGLDYYWMENSKEEQIRIFEEQIELAKELDLPVVVHSRDAMMDTISVLKNFQKIRTIIHCFSGNINDAEKLLEIGCYISFAGNVTYKNAITLQDAVKFVPIERLLLETDSPYLSPQPVRGKKNDPSNMKHIYEFVAGIRSIPIEDLSCEIEKNFKRLAERKD